MNLSDLIIVVRASTKDFERGMLRARAEIQKTQSTAARLNNVGGAAMGVGKNMTKFLTLPILAVGGASAVMAAKFEDDMTLLETQAGTSREEVEKLTTAVLKMSHEAGVQHGPEELAKGLYHLKSVGMDEKQAMDALRASEHLASVGHAELEASTNAVAGAWKSGIKGAQSFEEAAAVVNATVGAGNMRMDELVGAMGTGFLVNAKMAGASFQDVGAALATMTARGIPAVRSATAIKMAFAAMTNPSGTATKAMKKLGLGQLDLSKALSKGGLPGAMELLNKRLNGQVAVLTKVDGKMKTVKRELTREEKVQMLGQMFGAKSAQAVLTLIDNMEDYRRVQKQVVEGSTGEKFQEAISAQAKDASARWEHLKATMAGTAIEFGTLILPALVKIADGLAKMVGWIGKLSPGQRKLAIGFALAAAAAGPLLVVFGAMAKGAAQVINLTKTMAAMPGGVGKMAKKIGGWFKADPRVYDTEGKKAGNIFARAFSRVGLAAKTLGSKIKTGLLALGSTFANAGKTVGTKFASAAGVAAGGIKTGAAKVGSVMSSLGGFLMANPFILVIVGIVALVALFIVLWKKCEWFRNFWKGLWRHIVDIAKAVWPTIKAVWDKIWTTTKQVWGYIKPYVVGTLKALWAAIKVYFAVIVRVAKVAWALLVIHAKVAWKALSIYIRVAVAVIKGIIASIRFVVGVVRAVWNAVRGATQAVWNVVKAIVKRQVDAIVKVVHAVGKVFNLVRNAWRRVRETTRAIWNGLKDIIGGVIEWIWEKIEAVWDRIEGVYNRVKGWLGGSGETTQRGRARVTIPRHAEGAFIPATTGGLPFIGGEGGEPEWVVPASKAKDFASAVKGAGGGGASITINIANVNGTDRQAADRLARMASERLMAGVLRQMVGQNV